MEAPTSTFKVLGTEIRKKRMQLGLGTGELAARAGISRRYLSHLENGTREHMRPRKYVALRAELHASDEDLLAPPGTDNAKE
jgi:transcriptional regulator with XRE-family HTH domain